MDDRAQRRASKIEMKRKQKEALQKANLNAIGWLVLFYLEQ